ncbi:23S rRNA m(5)U-1939 methyltransferase [Bisgaardia hudsonensis]|uniref:23S rRNA (uracil(1939)-C(5))-methyltransferase RlmD n=1 Tax=Bisgaardia hudsonensis TaxID=109472 RepID=A0A4R2MXQ0_9PAST|nr:23S rRNA (uracil(1939)-C(5))-methyltransferase RlmD [Bisgaardia hudsonensis]QLB12167.1 23S rRNA methyltransferase [Bisgaardia hudsonensis]TCP12204.1 23S rRNA m(5)U-1939 methyltransferase [Bisgaardia hudsonensis]
MVLLYTPKKQQQKTNLIADIIDLDYQGLGIAKINGKTWFIENALPQEKVEFSIIEEKRQYGRGKVKKWLKLSEQRQSPKCSYYQSCGGCQSQHIPLSLQREAKQKALFQRLSKLQSNIEFMPMMIGEQWQYRRRIKLSICYDTKKKIVNIGFRQKSSQQIIPINHCDVIEIEINEILPKLTALLQQWSLPKTLGHIELVAADNGLAILLRITENLTKNDRTLLINFAKQQNLMLFIQDNYQIHHLCGEYPYYQLDDGIKLHFDIRDFIQVNKALNQKMVKTALNWLDLNQEDNVLDLFCGMGNFTLSLSKKVKSAVGIEGVSDMVMKAEKNAEQNHCDNVKFYQGNLDQPFNQQQWGQQHFNKILLDPPRTGAAFALQALCQLQAEKILYVSCNPATLVRDTEILLNFGYQLKKVAMIDMFPNTSHLESISLFERQ